MAFDRKLNSSIVCIAVGIVSIAGCSGGGGGGNPIEPPEPLPSAITVTTGQSAPPRFIPANASVAVGGTVTWRNASPVDHDVLSLSGAWPTTRLAPTESFQVSFPQAGEFDYICTIHQGMAGTIVVR
jgi:plastocyanin